jgi:hypothetical protein
MQALDVHAALHVMLHLSKPSTEQLIAPKSATCGAEVPNCCWLIDRKWFTLFGVYVHREKCVGVLVLSGMPLAAGLRP